MADSPVFDWACELIERETALSRLQARGTLRLVLGSAGLEPGTLTARQLKAIAPRLLPKELRARGVVEIDHITEQLTQCPPAVEQSAKASIEPEDVFKRFGRPK